MELLQRKQDAPQCTIASGEKAKKTKEHTFELDYALTKTK